MTGKRYVKTKVYRSFISVLFFVGLASSPVFASSTKSQSKSVLSLASSFYNQEDFNQQDYQVTDAEVSNKYVYKQNNFLYRHDLGGLFQLGSSEQAYDLNLSEAYISYKLKNNTFSFGRKKQSLSQVDEQWKLGLTNPLFNHDYLNPEQMGMFGLHHTYKNNNFYIQSFGSFVHLPSQGPKFELENERVTSLNPWFSLPPEQINEQGVVTPVRYGIDRPELVDVLFQGSFNLKLGYETKKSWFSLGYNNKPDNNLHRLYRFSEELATNSYFVQVDAITKRHELYTADVGAKFNDITFWGSYLKDSPDKNYARGQAWQETHLDEQNWLSVGARLDHFFMANLSVSTSYIKRLDKSNRKPTLLDFEELDAILSRSYFERSESLQFKINYKQNFRNNKKINLLSRYEYSLADQSQLAMANIKYSVKRFSMFAEGGVISAHRGDNSSFFSSHKGNDYFQIGAGYVF